ncbi:MAG: patatin-like phospholipase family protein [Anaerolineales bacterium]
MYRILSFDGGGILGVLSISLIKSLEDAQPGFLEKVDLFAGTSTGGILALGLAAGLSPMQCCELYELRGQFVFSRTLLHDLQGNVVGAKYSNQNLKQELERQFGDMTLGDLPKRVLITSVDLDNQPANPFALRTWKPKFFHNYPGPGSDAHERVVDVALRTSAAPTYFPLYQGFTDGGVVANNPTMCAVAQALHPGTGRQKLDDLIALSLGTGRNPRFLTDQNSNWGLIQWARPLIDLLLLEGTLTVVDYQCQQILGGSYHRLNPLLPEPIDLDDVGKVSRLKEIAAQAQPELGATLNWLTPIRDEHDRTSAFRGWFVD